MKCRLHNQPRRMVCARCDNSMCSMCAEVVDGAWFCPDCAVEERRIATGKVYRRFAAEITNEPGRREDFLELEVVEG